jgi:hypothetical protein
MGQIVKKSAFGVHNIAFFAFFDLAKIRARSNLMGHWDARLHGLTGEGLAKWKGGGGEGVSSRNWWARAPTIRRRLRA